MSAAPHRVRVALPTVLAGLVLAGCATQNSPSTLDPAGPAAARIAGLWWWLFWLGTGVWVLVTVLLLLALRSRRATRGGGIGPVVLGGVVLPVLVLPVVFFLNLDTLADVAGTSEDAIVIEMVGKQFWWEVRYPDADVVTANEFSIPVGRPVQLEVTASDVIHSFWVPQLHGKIDLVPGQVNTFTIEASRPGVFRGQCAEYCGIQHTKMELIVSAREDDDFDAWLAQMRAPRREPTSALAAAGERAFLEVGCAACHAIQGTPADGQLGPDLTHFASRSTIGAGAAPNTRGWLGGWIANSQTIKHGNLMPPMPVDPEQLQALIAYLESLE